MGAFINMRRPPKNRRALVDIGIAGPLSGLFFAIPILILGLSLSSLDVLPAQVPEGMSYQLEGNSVLYLALKYLVFGKLLPEPPDYNGLSPFLYWLTYFFTGKPVPMGGVDVMIHPVAWAGWAGILVTGLNLLPAGQLDGGHMLYVLFGKNAARRVYPIVLAGLLILGIFWNGWWLWAVLIFFLGRTHAEPLDQITPLDKRRKILAASALVLFFLTFTPVPLTLVF
jgi:membrane-associated protease RseP (regulator of RpoE activity)